MLLDIFSGDFFAGEVVFFLLCCFGAWRVGRSISSDWKPLSSLVISILLLGLGARFLHFALYEAQFISVSRYLVDTAVLLVLGILGYRHTRTKQMTTQYHWLYEKASPFSWRNRA